MFDYSPDYSFDKKFKKDKLIKFYPYVGKDYKDQKIKILILGESHYIEKDELSKLEEYNADISLTRGILIENYFANIRKDKTNPYPYVKCFRNTAAMITNKEYHCSDNIWRKLAFYNYFQKIVGVGAKGKEFIDESLIEKSRVAYFNVLETLKPTIVIAWGIGSLYYKWVPQEKCEIIDEENFLYRYIDKQDTLIWHIRHPSQGFSYEAYHQKLITIMKEAKIDPKEIIKTEA